LDKRAFEKEILEAASKAHPDYVQAHDERYHREGFASRIAYLEGHGLLEAKWLQGNPPIPIVFKITSRGLDFLADDGGLSAILNVVVVRFEAETIKTLLIGRIEAAPGEKSAKDELISQIKKLPAEGLKEVTKKAIESGLANAPQLLTLIHTWVAPYI
jgi:hypothetical protein